MAEMVIKWEVGNGVDMGEEATNLEQYSMHLKFQPYNLHRRRKRNTNKTETNPRKSKQAIKPLN